MTGAIKAIDAIVAEVVLSRMQPDRNRNWRTIRPFTTGEIADAVGLKPRQVELSTARLRKAFTWWRGRRTEGGNVYRMGPDGVMVGSSLPHSRAFARDAKKVAKEEAISKEPTSNSLSEDRGTDDVPVADRLRDWREALSEEIVLFGLGLGLPARLVLAAADRFVAYYIAHPERMRGDPTQMFCSQIWLRRDATRFVAKHGLVAIADPVPVTTDLATDGADQTAPRDGDEYADHAICDDDQDTGSVDDSVDYWRLQVTGSDGPPPRSRAEIIAQARAIAQQHAAEMRQ